MDWKLNQFWVLLKCSIILNDGEVFFLDRAIFLGAVYQTMSMQPTCLPARLNIQPKRRSKP